MCIDTHGRRLLVWYARVPDVPVRCMLAEHATIPWVHGYLLYMFCSCMVAPHRAIMSCEEDSTEAVKRLCGCIEDLCPRNSFSGGLWELLLGIGMCGQLLHCWSLLHQPLGNSADPVDRTSLHRRPSVMTLPRRVRQDTAETASHLLCHGHSCWATHFGSQGASRCAGWGLAGCCLGHQM